MTKINSQRLATELNELIKTPYEPTRAEAIAEEDAIKVRSLHTTAIYHLERIVDFARVKNLGVYATTDETNSVIIKLF